MGTVMSLSANPPLEPWFHTNTRGTESSFHGRSRRGERQSIRGRGVSNCPISGCGLRSVHRARRIVRMTAHSQRHNHVHAGHSHVHDHGHAGRAHSALRPSVLGWAMAATLGLVVAEVFGGILGRSVALLNDALHNLSDVPALGISYLAMRWAERPADSEKTYGYHRAGTLAAFTNAFVLVLLSLWLGYEAVQRLRTPVEVIESWMIWTSIAALAVNGGITLALVRGRGDLNLRSILIHNFGDALSNIAIVVGALIIRATGAHWIDPLLGLAIGLLVLWSSIGILRESSHLLLEGRPHEMSVEDVARAILTVEGVQEVHDVHVWSLGGGHNALSLHARIPDMHLDECERLLVAIQQLAAKQFGIGHTTVQLERAGLPAKSGYVMPEPAKK
ncbi:MAG: cation transporter [Acidobacteria bacterium]|nr:MAG: cation transporter [Acidobacteriota bacterium]